MVELFERGIAEFVEGRHGVAVSSGTAALHAAMYAIDIGPGDEVIVPSITFVATANAVVFQGGTPVFVDVNPHTLLIDTDKLKDKITPRTKAVISVDYAGQPCEYDRLHEICDEHRLSLVADACHALGAKYKGRKVGSIADLTAFSFHPVKHITTGEGGMVITDSAEYARRMRFFRNHGITSDHSQRTQHGSWFYEMVDLGYNYRITDIQCALGLSQLRKLPGWITRRREIAETYDNALKDIPSVKPLAVSPDVYHAYHLYVICIDPNRFRVDRATIYAELRSQGIGVNVHYIPVHLHPFYRRRFGTNPGLCPVAEAAYNQIISLPVFPTMSDQDLSEVITAMRTVVETYGTQT
jgi:perosamine synthetase